MPQIFAIMLNYAQVGWIGELLCSNLCRHNVPRPSNRAKLHISWKDTSTITSVHVAKV